jgi:hypothetical protein
LLDSEVGGGGSARGERNIYPALAGPAPDHRLDFANG